MDKYVNSPVGTGPYTFDQYLRGMQINLSANTNYWGGSSAVKSAKYIFRSDSSVRAAMVSTGEATGDLTSMLDSVTTVLQEEIDGQVEGLAAKIEVLLLLVLGGVVGGLLMVLYLPILQLASSASDGLGG